MYFKTNQTATLQAVHYSGNRSTRAVAEGLDHHSFPVMITLLFSTKVTTVLFLR